MNQQTLKEVFDESNSLQKQELLEKLVKHGYKDIAERLLKTLSKEQQTKMAPLSIDLDFCAYDEIDTTL